MSIFPYVCLRTTPHRSGFNSRMLQLLGSLLVLLSAGACAPLSSESQSDSVQQAQYVSIGGVQQWITIRGSDRSDPVLLYVHGGPGAAQSAFVDIYAPYEEDFVLVHWDQRGAGETFARYGLETPDLSPGQLISDGVEVAEYVREQFPDNDIVLLGHSYGSFIASGIWRQRPELFSAYVGTGQITRWDWMTRLQKEHILSAARQNGDEETVDWLESMEKVTLDGRWFGTLSRYMSEADNQWLETVQSRFSSGSQTGDQSMQALREGQNFSGSRLIETFGEMDPVSNASDSPIPVCFIQGSEDLQTPTAAVERYLALLDAPEKALHVIEGAGHFAIATHTAEFLTALSQCPGITLATASE